MGVGVLRLRSGCLPARNLAPISLVALWYWRQGKSLIGNAGEMKMVEDLCSTHCGGYGNPPYFTLRPERIPGSSRPEVGLVQ
jgi:hypothetical protein